MVKRRKISKWPLAFAIAAVVLSILLAVRILPAINTDEMLPYALVGYVLTPFAVVAALMWARGQDLKLQGDRLYLRLDGQNMIKTIGFVVVASFIPAFVHIWYIASYVRSVLS